MCIRDSIYTAEVILCAVLDCALGISPVTSFSGVKISYTTEDETGKETTPLTALGFHKRYYDSERQCPSVPGMH